MSTLVYKVPAEQPDQNAKYYLRGQDENPSGHSEDIEISEGQFRAITELSANSAGASGNPSEADIVRLHQESDPASPFFKGSEPVDGGITSETAAGTEQSKTYYELTGDKLDPVADAVPDPQGTTTVSTEEATRPYEALAEQLAEAPIEDYVAPTPEVVEHNTAESETQQEPGKDDAGNTGA